MSKTLLPSAALGAALVLVGCASTPSPQELDREAVAMMKASFRDQGIAKVDRLDQDAVQQACSSATPPSAAVLKELEARELATIRWPAGGRYFGDWKAGEKLAQNGSGMTWREKSADAQNNGGSCYNCHQIDKAEISYGTIGPSLYNYGKLRGIKDVTAPSSAEVVQYTWGKLWNSKAYSACSHMPRFGHAKVLDEEQIRNLMSLLLDPRSPVNQ